MKKLVLTTILALAAAVAAVTTASAQLNIKAGYANSDWSDGTGKGSNRSGLAFGVGYEIPLNASRSLGLRPALTYTCAFQTTDTSPYIKKHVTDQTLGLPVHIKFSLPVSDDFRFYLFAGPSLGLGLGYSVKETFTRDPNLPPDPINAKNLEGTIISDLYSGKVKGSLNDPETLENRRIQNPHLERFDVSLSGGVGAQWRRVFVEAGYDYGLLNRSKKQDTIKHNQLSVTLGYAF